LNLKALFVVFLCLFSVSIICNVTMVTLNADGEWSGKVCGHKVHIGYLINGGIEPSGDPIEADGWP